MYPLQEKSERAHRLAGPIQKSQFSLLKHSLLFRFAEKALWSSTGRDSDAFERPPVSRGTGWSPEEHRVDSQAQLPLDTCTDLQQV